MIPNFHVHRNVSVHIEGAVEFRPLDVNHGPRVAIIFPGHVALYHREYNASKIVTGQYDSRIDARTSVYLDPAQAREWAAKLIEAAEEAEKFAQKTEEAVQIVA